MTLGDYIRDALEERNLSAAEFARRVGVSNTTISNLIKPGNTAGVSRLDLLNRFALELNEPLADLIRACGYDIEESRNREEYFVKDGKIYFFKQEDYQTAAPVEVRAWFDDGNGEAPTSPIYIQAGMLSEVVRQAQGVIEWLMMLQLAGITGGDLIRFEVRFPEGYTLSKRPQRQPDEHHTGA